MCKLAQYSPCGKFLFYSSPLSIILIIIGVILIAVGSGSVECPSGCRLRDCHAVNGRTYDCDCGSTCTDGTTGGSKGVGYGLLGFGALYLIIVGCAFGCSKCVRKPEEPIIILQPVQTQSNPQLINTSSAQYIGPQNNYNNPQIYQTPQQPIYTQQIPQYPNSQYNQHQQNLTHQPPLITNQYNAGSIEGDVSRT
jgi:hypothetical protein